MFGNKSISDSDTPFCYKQCRMECTYKTWRGKTGKTTTIVYIYDICIVFARKGINVNRDKCK